MKRDGQNHHGSSRQMVFGSFHLIDVPVQMRDDMIKKEQKEYSKPEADECRKKSKLIHTLRLIDCWIEKAPDGSRCHHAGRKSRQSPLDTGLQFIFQ